MSLIRSSLMFAALSFSIAVVMETASGTDGAFDRVLDRTQAEVENGVGVAVGLMERAGPALTNVASK